MSLLRRIFGEAKERAALDPLYRAIVAAGRDPSWYLAGEVPDTIDGRFDMIAALTALVLLRLEAEGEAGQAPSVLLTELFIQDMDGEMRQLGIGDYVVGKHVGRMVGALGGRLGAYRTAQAEDGFEEAVRRNIFRDAPPSDAAVGIVAVRLKEYSAALAASSMADLLAARLPELPA